MKFISERLSSLKLTMVILSVLVFWLAWGILLADSDAQTSGFRIMNGTLAPEWFKMPDAVSMLLKTWFLGLCFFMGLLGVNLGLLLMEPHGIDDGKQTPEIKNRDAGGARGFRSGGPGAPGKFSCWGIDMKISGWRKGKPSGFSDGYDA